jgi:hypothetical protein
VVFLHVGGETWTPLTQHKTNDPLSRLAFEKNKLYALAGSTILVYGSE